MSAFQFGNGQMCGDSSHDGSIHESYVRGACTAQKAVMSSPGSDLMNIVHATPANLQAGAVAVTAEDLAHPNFAAPPAPPARRTRERDDTPSPLDMWSLYSPFPGSSVTRLGRTGDDDLASPRTSERASSAGDRRERASPAERYPTAERYPERTSGSNRAGPSRPVDTSSSTWRPETRSSELTVGPETSSNTRIHRSERSGHREARQPEEVLGYREGQAGHHRRGRRTASAKPAIEGKRETPTTQERQSRQARKIQDAQTTQTRSGSHDGGVRLPQSTTGVTQSVPSLKVAETKAAKKPESSKLVSDQDPVGADNKRAKGHGHSGKTQKPRDNDPVIFSPNLRLRPTAPPSAIPETKSMNPGATPQVQPAQRAEGSDRQIVEAAEHYTDVARPTRGEYELLYPSIDISPKAGLAAERAEEAPVLPKHHDAAIAHAEGAEGHEVQADGSESDFRGRETLSPSASSGSEVSIDFEEARESPVSQPNISPVTPHRKAGETPSSKDNDTVPEADENEGLPSSKSVEAAAYSATQRPEVQTASPIRKESPTPPVLRALDVEAPSVGPGTRSVASASMPVAPEPEGQIPLPTPHTEDDWVIIDRQSEPPAALSPLARRLKAEKEVADTVRAKRQKKSTAHGLGADLFDREEACGLEEEDWTLV